MKLKFLLICLMTISLAACFNDKNNNHKPKNDDKPHAQSVVDFNKAALLNVEMGEAYLAQGQITRAKQKFIHALELKPKMPEAHSSIGYFFETVGDLEEAERHYKQAISFGDRKGKFYNNYGTFLCRQGRYKEADKAFNSAINDKHYIKTAEAYENAGVCAMKQPDVDKAYAYLQTALKRDPFRYSAMLELASLELNRHNLLVARDYLDRYAAAVEPPNARSLWLRIQLGKQAADQNTIKSAALQLQKLFPQSTEYQLYLESVKHG
jgi:type IV pilus assembly protein PilF